MPTMLSRRAAVLAKVEPTEGVDAAPVPTLDAVLVEQPLRITFSPNVIDTTEVNPSLDPFDPIVGGMNATIEFDVYLKGNGTPGSFPEWGVLMQGCGLSQTSNGAISGTCAAGASQSQATLGAASAIAQIYRGQPLGFTGVVNMVSAVWDYSGAGTIAKITHTAAAVITTTTNWYIPVNVTYTPTSSNIPSLTIWVYMDGVLYKFIGCRGTCPLTLTARGPGRISFRFMGQLTTKTDAALPTTTVYDATRPPVWKGGAFTINSAGASVQTLSIDPGNNLVQPDNPGAAEGFDPAIITARQVRGSINPKEVLVATRDLMGSFRNQVKQPVFARLGADVGNHIIITIPSALYLNQTPGDTNGYQVTDVPFHATGQDSGYTISVY